MHVIISINYKGRECAMCQYKYDQNPSVTVGVMLQIYKQKPNEHYNHYYTIISSKLRAKEIVLS